MFKSGDKIVCIIDDNIKYPYTIEKIILNKVYTFYRYSPLNKAQLSVKEHSHLLFLSENFIALKEYRKQKLEKIK